MLAVPLYALMAASALAQTIAAPTFQDLMSPDMLPDAQRGMGVESVLDGGDDIRVTTTGAAVSIGLEEGTVRFRQRIGVQRTVAVLRTQTPWRGAKVTHDGEGFFRATVESPRLTLRINGDSLFMLHAHEPLEARVTRRIQPAWNASYLTNHLIADELGAFGIYCSNEELDDGFDAYGKTVATYPLSADDVLWVGVCPPQEYPWEQSLESHVVWHWHPTEGYPSDEALRSWQPHGDTVLLQSEVALWEDWNLDFIPRHGTEEYARVHDTIHSLGQRYMVYTSPFYFLTGTPHENLAFSDWAQVNALALPVLPGRGENMPIFMEAIERVMTDLKPDGLYFDGQYPFDAAAQYALARRSREVVGEDGLLEWHSTAALGMEDCYLPQADAYVDYILRGEGRSGVSDENLRFFVSGYNISNSIGVLCNNITMPVTPEQCARVLAVNARYHTRFEWLEDPAVMDTMEREYFERLTPTLRSAVEAEARTRHTQARQVAARAREEERRLRSPAEWAEPLFALEFDDLPEAEAAVSPANEQPFSVADGSLHIRALAHTYAYLQVPVDVEPSGFEVKLRMGTDGGMNWGPGALLRWANGAILRVGARVEGILQANMHYVETLAGEHEPAEWVWIRVRWAGSDGVIEASRDGMTFEPIHSFRHGGAFGGRLVGIDVGKVPGQGGTIDHSEPGDLGESDIDYVRLYGE